MRAGGRSLGMAIAGRTWRPVRVPVAALRGRRVGPDHRERQTPRVCSSPTWARCSGRPRCASGASCRPIPTRRAGRSVGVVVTGIARPWRAFGSRSRGAGRRLAPHRRASAWSARERAPMLKVKLPQARSRARRVHGQRGGGGRRFARAHPPGVIAHLDLDAFFAAVEQLDRPELRGKPVVVGGDPRGRGVVATASYEARRFGIRSAMSAAEAYRRCPRRSSSTPDMARYRERSRTVWARRREPRRARRAGRHRRGLPRPPRPRARALGRAGAARSAAGGGARRHRPLVLARLRNGKTVAKIASDHRKPGGIFVVAPGREAAFLAPLPLRALPGIGPRGEQRLAAAGLVDDRRSGAARTTRRSPRSAWARSAATCASAPAASIRGPSSSRRPIRSRSARRRRSSTTCSTRSRWRRSSRRSPRTSSRASSATASPPAP